MKWECPHCHVQESESTRIQGPDEMAWLSDFDVHQELWQCEECGGYFTAKFQLVGMFRLFKEREFLESLLPETHEQKPTRS